MQRLLITHLKQASNLMHYSGHYKAPTSSLIAKQGSQIYNSIHHHSQPLKVHGFFSIAHFARKRNHKLPKQTNFEINQSFGSSSSWKSWLNKITPSDMILGIVTANVAVLMLWRASEYRKLMIANFTVSVENFKSGSIHTLITSAFSHVRTGHVIFNMIALFAFGQHLGRVLGPVFMLKLYIAGAVTGSIFSLLHSAVLAFSSKDEKMRNYHLRKPFLGANGAVTAIILLDIFLFPKTTFLLYMLIPCPGYVAGGLQLAGYILMAAKGDYPATELLGGAAAAAMAWGLLRKGRF